MKLHCFLFAAMLPVVFPVVAAAARTTQDATPEMRCVVFDEKDSSVCFVLDTALWQLRQAATVSVAGTFNFWDADAEGYRMSFDSGQWKLRLPVDSVDVPGNCGRPEYKFVADGKFLDVPDFVPQGWRFDNSQPCLVIPTDEKDAKAVASANKKASKIKNIIDFKLPDKRAMRQLCNFRLVPGTAYLYRSYHPFKASRPDNSTDVMRLRYVAGLSAEAGIASDICLSGDETDSLKSYEINRTEIFETIPDYYRAIMEKGDVLYLGADYAIPDYQVVYYKSDSDLFSRWVKDLVSFIIDEKHPVPMSIHCRLGTDRTGVFCAVIAAICGAEWEDIAKDYAESSEMGIGDHRDPLLLKYSLDKLVGCDVSEVEDLQSAIIRHFTENGILTADEITRLQDRLN